MPTPVALPESPVAHRTDRGIIRSVTEMLQSPVPPEAGEVTPGPPGPLAALFPWVVAGAGAAAAPEPDA